MRYRFFNTYEPVISLYRDLAPVLASGGGSVDIVVSRGEYRAGRNIAEHFRERPDVRVTRVPSLGAMAQSGWKGKAIVNLAYVVFAGARALLGPGAETNLFLTQPPFFSALGPLLSGLRRQRYYCTVMDIQPDLLVAYGALAEDTVVTRSLSWLTRVTLRRADGVVVIGRCMADRVAAMGVRRERIHLIPNWADQHAIVPVSHDANSFRSQEPWRDRFVVMYAGNMGVAQYFDDLLDAAEALQDRDDVAFVLVGGGVRRKALEEEVARRSMANVHFYPFLHTIHGLSEILGAGDLHLVTLREPCLGLAVPSKAYGVMAAGRPFLFQGHADCETARMITEEEVGTFVPCGDAHAVAETIVRHAEDPSLGASRGRRGRALAEGRYSRESGVQRYAELLS